MYINAAFVNTRGIDWIQKNMVIKIVRIIVGKKSKNFSR